MTALDYRSILTQPDLYPGQSGPIEVRETHSSLVFLTENEVFKLKKAVDLGFLNYSTPRRRALMCRREVTLNRRLAPSVYFGVKRLVRLPGGRWAIRATGKAEDYLVHMRRLPDAATLEARIASGAAADTLALIARVGRRLGEFHNSAPPVSPRLGSPALVLKNARDNFTALESADVLKAVSLRDRLRAYTDRFVRENRGLFEARAAAGRTRDGHGDLRCEHIYDEEGGELSIIDCVEFSRSIRAGDVALDLSFLYMNLQALGYPDLAARLVEEWEETTGDDISEVLDFYACYRAMVRAKVSYIRSRQPAASPSDRDAAIIEALGHLVLAARLTARERRPWLMVMTGLPATGKSTAARLAAALTGASLLVADRLRKQLAGLSPADRASAPIDRGIYAPEMSARVYGQLLDRAEEALARGRSVVLDATFRRRSDRAAAAALARRRGARLLVLECRAPDSVVRRRIGERGGLAADPSDATLEVYEAHKKTFEPATEIPAHEHLLLATDRPPLEIARALLAPLVTEERSAPPPD